MVWPFSMLWSRSAPAPPPSPAKKPARKPPATPGADAALVAAWQGRTVGELRETLEEVGWDSESLDRLLARVGAPEAAGVTPDAGTRRTPAAGGKRSRGAGVDYNEQDEEIDLSPRPSTGRKQAKSTKTPSRRVSLLAGDEDDGLDLSPRRKPAKDAAAKSPVKSPSRPPVDVSDAVAALSPAQLRSEFERIFGYPSNSGNLDWLRRKLDALKKGTDLNSGGARGRPPTHTLPAGASP